MKIHVVFPKYIFFSSKSTDEQRIILREIAELSDKYLNIDGVLTQYAVEDESAVRLLDKVVNKEAVTFLCDKQFIERYNDRYCIYPDEIWRAAKDLNPICTDVAKRRAPIKEVGQDISSWLENRITFCKNTNKCNMEEYLKKRGNNVLYIEDNSRTNLVSYSSIHPVANDGRLFIRININRVYSVEAYMGGVPINTETAIQILRTM